MPELLLTPELEEVVLLDHNGTAVGRADKARIHNQHTPLHSAFSIFLFNQSGEMLVQQRAWSKKTWPGIWSNACCGHPLPSESLEAAAHRRLADELGLRGLRLTLALPNFRYRAEYLGVVENEICPVFIGFCEACPRPNPAEVAATDWVNWTAFIENDPQFDDYSPWSKWEAAQLAQSPLLAGLTGKNHFCSRRTAAVAKRRNG
ncbi:isopentenyl-diphosphate Delta-isomerase [Coraliomargarita sp. W4R72]